AQVAELSRVAGAQQQRPLENRNPRRRVAAGPAPEQPQRRAPELERLVETAPAQLARVQRHGNDRVLPPETALYQDAFQRLDQEPGQTYRQVAAAPMLHRDDGIGQRGAVLAGDGGLREREGNAPAGLAAVPRTLSRRDRKGAAPAC